MKESFHGNKNQCPCLLNKNLFCNNKIFLLLYDLILLYGSLEGQPTILYVRLKKDLFSDCPEFNLTQRTATKVAGITKIGEVENLPLGDCFVLCFNTSGCYTFSHNTNTGHCALYTGCGTTCAWSSDSNIDTYERVCLQTNIIGKLLFWFLSDKQSSFYINLISYLVLLQQNRIWFLIIGLYVANMCCFRSTKCTKCMWRVAWYTDIWRHRSLAMCWCHGTVHMWSGLWTYERQYTKDLPCISRLGRYQADMLENFMPCHTLPSMLQLRHRRHWLSACHHCNSSNFRWVSIVCLHQ